MTPAPAVRLGRYELLDVIASGGMGTVHYARAEDGAVVAIKRLHVHRSSDPQFVARFSREAKIAARVQHPNVVRTLEVVESAGELFVVMEYLHGESLARLLRASRERNEAVPADIAVAIMIDVLRGLHAAHEVRDDRGEPINLIHRDVSPENVLVGEDGVARVLDFGIARADDQTQTTVEGQMKGKLAYMAPELIDHAASRASDVYAAGVCLWEALTGQRLFSGDNESVVLAKVLAGLVTRPRKIAPDISPELDALVMRALARKPGDRFASASEMADALEVVVAPASAERVGSWTRALADEALQARAKRVAAHALPSAHPSLSVVPLVPQRARKKPWFAFALVVVALVATVTIVTLALHSQDDAIAIPPASAASVTPVMPSAEPMPSASAAASATPEIELIDPPVASVAAPKTTHASKHPPTIDCTQPYVVDDQGLRHYKKACLK